METRTTQEQEVIKRAREEIEKKTGKSPEQIYEEREKRVRDAIDLKEPDRVPVLMRGGFFDLKYAGLPHSTMFYDHLAYEKAVIRALLDFEPDLYQSVGTRADSGLAMEILGMKQYQWPGGPLPPNITSQFVDKENMRPEEYDLFMTDPTDFMLRCYLPRILGALQPMSKLPTLGQNLAGAVSGLIPLSAVLAKPEFQQLAQTLLKAGEEQAKFKAFEEELGDLGFPPIYYPGGFASSPFDFITNYLRGMRGTMADMFQRPEKLLAACEKVLEWRLARAVPADPKKRGNPKRVGGPTHFTSDRFLSRKQFETFVWPTWKKALLKNIELGYVPACFFEGKGDDRLEYFLELPKGKVAPRFDQVDMARAKAILGNHCCIGGDVPGPLMEVGSPQEVEEYCRNLIKVCGKGGGFILSSACTLDEAKPANVRAMIDSVKKYGRY